MKTLQNKFRSVILDKAQAVLAHREGERERSKFQFVVDAHFEHKWSCVANDVKYARGRITCVCWELICLRLVLMMETKLGVLTELSDLGKGRRNNLEGHLWWWGHAPISVVRDPVAGCPDQSSRHRVDFINYFHFS